MVIMASGTEEIISCQKQVAEEISRLLRNFKKDGPERKTQEYVQKRIKDLEKFWVDFSRLHAQLEQSIPKEHPYFTEKLYDKTRDIYRTAVDLLSNWKPAVPASRTPSKLMADTSKTSTMTTTAAITTTTLSTATTSANFPASTATAVLPTDALSAIIHEYKNKSNTPVQSLGVPPPEYNHEAPFTSTVQPTAYNTWNPSQQLPITTAAHQEASRLNNFPKLPPIKIPKFSGDYKEWKSFIDIFTNVIHNNAYLSNVEKMQYLLYHLEGDARRVISHLQLNDSNYNTALHLIQGRFNNNRKIITTYVNTIIDAKNTEYRSQDDIIRLYDLIRECLEALKTLSCNTDEWGPMIVCISMRKLDTESLRLFEESLSNPREMPTTEELLNFLEKRYQVLDCIKSARQQRPNAPAKSSKRSFHITFKRSCAVCSKNHSVYQCEEFKQMSIDDRDRFIKQKNLCSNCLVHDKTEKCRSTKACVHCKRRHHSLLHRNNNKNHNSVEIPHNTKNVASHLTTQEEQGEEATTFHISKRKIPTVLLPTAMVRIKNMFGQLESFRALIDPGSQVSLITEEAVQILKLQKERIRATIQGVGETESAKANSKVNFALQLRHRNDSYLSVEAIVLSKLNSHLPETQVTGIDISKYKNIVLADPNFDKPGPISVLLGADVYANIITEGIKKEKPAAQNTKLGWILFGNIPSASQETTRLSSFLSIAEIEEKLEKFWEIKDNTSSTQSNGVPEEHFKATHKRDEEGRYIVRLPFKNNVEQLGQSRNTAIARLIQMDKKLKRNPKALAEYNNFLSEYLSLGHMSPATSYNGEEATVYYLPHHAVFKEDSTTTKLRVVFDASCKSTSGISLNDLLHTGPKIQQELTDILLRWRKHRYVYTADIEKMFRQIKVNKEDRNYQRILWKQHPEGPIREFVLNTVTYGTGPATYLAVRTLRQLAEDEGNQFPIGRRILNSDFYIDDMLTGADTKDEARSLQEQTIALLNKGGFNLRKWTSNNEELLKNIPEDIREKGILEIKESETIKALGVHWNPKKDEFQFKLKFQESDSTITKRVLLSKIATIFDPLGWLAPVTMAAKLIMQALWKSGTEWDQQPPSEIIEAWKKLENELQELHTIRIPRWIKYRVNYEIQLHGFCDASEKGYAAVIYSRIIDSFGKTHLTLLTAKTKVAPLNQKVTLPRLELCGALLLAQLLKTATATLEIESPTITAWCDSEIVLAWIARSPNTLHTFVANRISEIQGLFPTDIWRHVPSQDNPADVASRGTTPKRLISHKSWWRGPLWLSQPPEAWPSRKFTITTDEEVKRTVRVLNTTATLSEIYSCSTFTRQVRVIAYCQRFIKNCRLPKAQRRLVHLSSEELQASRICILKVVQQEAFFEEITTLKKGKPLKKTSKVLSLHPFLDEKGILRVGGRIQNSYLPEDAKHQILLPQKHHITNLIIEYAHQQTMHGGTQLTLNYIRAQYWIINAKSAVQSRNHRCIKCLRHSQNSTQQLMGNLPTMRITPSPPFSHSGIDYAGPFLTKMSKGRGAKSIKGYIALFICMVTKAVHLELVSDLTTDAFLAAYKRFVARRGKCNQIYSDNGTNFVGARNKMDKDLQLAINQSTKCAAEVTANDGTEWKFIPAASPHLGGLWEAGIKSVKSHLKRVLGETLLTYEEFSTVLYQVEACLNSRPIGQQSSDPTDLEPLTPGHFLIGRPLIAPPEPHASNKDMHQRWRLVTKLQQDIWKRWSQEYLSSLQQRSKWKTENKNPVIGELVLVKDDNLPPQKWSLGRVVQLHPGDDGIVRIVSIKYKNDIKKRPLNKLCQLPINIHETNNEDSIIKTVTTATMAQNRGSKRAQRSNTPQEAELWSKPEHFDRTNVVLTNQEVPRAQEPPTKKRRVKIAPCTWATRLLHSTLLILYWLTIAFAQDYEVFQPNSGLYIENLGYTQIKRGNLRLQITFPTDEIIQDQKMVDTTWKQIKDMCDKTKALTDITHCDVLFQHMSTRRHKLLQDMDEIINHLALRRKKRGLLGRLLTSVFGVNDEIYTDVEVLQHNQQSLLHSTSQQILFLNAKINQSNFAVLEKMRHFDARLSQVISSIKEMNTWYSKADHNRISIEVIATYLTAEDYFNELQDKYNHWLNAMHNHGHLLSFITLHDINAAIQNTSGKIGSNLLILPTPQERLDIRTENNTIKLYGYLNIVERTVYELIHVTPTPHRIEGDKLAVIDSKFSTLAINFNHQTYFNLDDQELRSCSILAQHVYLCTPTVVHNIEHSPSCIIDEIYDRHPKTNCEMHQIRLTGTVWKALMIKNTWLYMTNETKVVAVICNGARKELLLNNTGIIHLNDNCYIKTKEITLKTTQDQTMDVITSHIKEITPSSITINYNKPPSALPAGLLIQPHEQLLDYSMDPEPYPDILQKTLVAHSISATTLLLIFILALLVWRYWATLKTTLQSCDFKRNSTQPVPTPRRRSEGSIRQDFDRVLTSSGRQHVHA